MNLKLHYDPECDAIGLDYNQSSGATYEVDGLGWVMIDLPDEASHEAIALEVIGISAWLPSGRRGYCKETDSLTFGGGVENAAVIGRNGDLIAYWRRDSTAADGLTAFAVELQNASKHLAPVIAAVNQLTKTPLVPD